MMKINLLNAFPGDDPTCKRIPLTQGQSTLVSTEDYDRLSQWKWYALWARNVKSFYAVREIRLPNGRRTTQYMHREVLGLQPGDPGQVDHENHDTLDNRRSNLEAVTPRENQSRRRDQSEYGPGVQKRGKRFKAKARIRGRMYHVGTYDTPEEAQKARRLYVGKHESLVLED